MEIREYVNSEYDKTLDTDGLRSNFLVKDILPPGEITMTYSHVDRMIIGGITPAAKGTSEPIHKVVVKVAI